MPYTLYAPRMCWMALAIDNSVREGRSTLVEWVGRTYSVAVRCRPLRFSELSTNVGENILSPSVAALHAATGSYNRSATFANANIVPVPHLSGLLRVTATRIQLGWGRVTYIQQSEYSYSTREIKAGKIIAL